jgi:hypothetical protein
MENPQDSKPKKFIVEGTHKGYTKNGSYVYSLNLSAEALDAYKKIQGDYYREENGKPEFFSKTPFTFPLESGPVVIILTPNGSAENPNQKGYCFGDINPLKHTIDAGVKLGFDVETQLKNAWKRYNETIITDKGE